MMNGEFLTESQGRRLNRLAERERTSASRVSYVLTAPERCKAESFKVVEDWVSGAGSTKESWEMCRKRVVKGDVLCAVHRRMLNQACAHGGLVQFKTNVKVPFEAIDKGGCALPAPSVADAVLNDTKKAVRAKAEADKYFEDIEAGMTKFEINNREHILNAFLKFHGSS